MPLVTASGIVIGLGVGVVLLAKWVQNKINNAKL